MKRLSTILLLICLAFLPVKAVPNEITTFEMGGATSAPGIAGKHELILEEQFFQYDSRSQNQSYAYTLLDTKLRYGLIEDKLEFRFGSRGLALAKDDAGLTNLFLGTKLRFWNESKYIPVADLILDFEIPVGDRDLRNPGFDHSYMLVLGKRWTEKLGSVINLSLDFSSFESNTSGTATAVSMPYAFNYINYSPIPELSIFSHVFGTWSFTGNLPNPLSLDLGASYALTKDLVVVSWVSKGINEAAPGVSVDAGVVYRF